MAQSGARLEVWNSVVAKTKTAVDNTQYHAGRKASSVTRRIKPVATRTATPAAIPTRRAFASRRCSTGEATVLPKQSAKGAGHELAESPRRPTLIKEGRVGSSPLKVEASGGWGPSPSSRQAPLGDLVPS